MEGRQQLSVIYFIGRDIFHLQKMKYISTYDFFNVYLYQLLVTLIKVYIWCIYNVMEVKQKFSICLLTDVVNRDNID